MMLAFLTAISLVLANTPISKAHAPEDNKASLIGFDGLQKSGLADTNRLRILDVRPKADYDRGHIPGAVWVNVKAAETLAAKPEGLKDKSAWKAWIAPSGIGQIDEVVVYGDNRQLDAARVWWLLSYLGVECPIRLLDGNYKLWASQGRPISTDVPKISPQPFAVKFRTDRLATREDVSELLKKPGTTRVIDARTLGEHAGTEKRSKRAGHIPTACHLEWVDLVDRDGRFLDEKTLREKIAKIGITSGSPVVTHCQGGGRASVDAFVFEKLGHPTRNYYLGWSDWGNADDTPIEAATKPKP